MSDFNKWKKSLPSSRHRKEVEKWLREELNGSAIDQARIDIEGQLSNHIEHDRIVGKIAFLFLKGEEINKKTDCEFITFEPLIELNEPNADILVYEPSKHVALIFEIKTGSKGITHLKKIKGVIDNNIGLLEKLVSDKINKVKYILIVNNPARANKLKGECNKKSFSLGYTERDILTIHSSCLTNIKDLDRILLQGISLEKGADFFVMLGSHKCSILENTLLKTLQNKLKAVKTEEKQEKIREFSKKEFTDAFMELAFISKVGKDTRFKKYLDSMINHIIQEGIDSGLIVKINGKNKYRIYTQASVALGKVATTLRTKYVDYYIEKHKRKIAEENVKMRYDRKYAGKQMKFDV